MVKSTITLLAVSAIASVALAQAPVDTLAFGAPVASTVWTAGTSAVVAWNNDCSDLPDGTNTTFPITLNQQVSGVQQPVGGGPIGTLDCSKKGSTTVQVPNVPSGEAYSILAAPGGVLSYSALFKIVGTTANTTSAPLTPPATTVGNSTTPTGKTTPTGSGSTPTKTMTSVTQSPIATPSAAGALKVGSTAALVVLAGVASMML